MSVRERLTEIVISILTEMKPEEFLECPDKMRTIPITDLGCDSQDDVDFICSIVEETGIEISSNETLLFTSDGNRYITRTVSEIVDALVALSS